MGERGKSCLKLGLVPIAEPYRPHKVLFPKVLMAKLAAPLCGDVGPSLSSQKGEEQGKKCSDYPSNSPRTC